MDVKFSSAVHALILISESEECLDSEFIAGSIGTNPSYVRKILASLKKGGIIESRQGRKGFSLVPEPGQLTLLDIYHALYPETGSVFRIHRNPNQCCPVGRYIQPVLQEIYAGIDRKLENELRKETLQDCINRLAMHLEAENRPSMPAS